MRLWTNFGIGQVGQDLTLIVIIPIFAFRFSYVDIRRRSAGVHQDVKDIAMKAQKRLWKKRRRLADAKKGERKINVAMARELAGFIWAIAHQKNLVEAAA